MDKDLERVRRQIRSKAFNVLERVEQIVGPTQIEVEHLDAAIKYLAKTWEDCKVWSEDDQPPSKANGPQATGRYTRPDAKEPMQREH